MIAASAESLLCYRVCMLFFSLDKSKCILVGVDDVCECALRLGKGNSERNHWTISFSSSILRRFISWSHPSPPFHPSPLPFHPLPHSPCRWKYISRIALPCRSVMRNDTFKLIGGVHQRLKSSLVASLHRRMELRN